MNWHLNIQIPKFPFEIHHQHKIFTIGSCFVENLSDWFKKRHFNVFSNPNGVLFNPISIYLSLKNIIETPHDFDEKLLFSENNVWKSFLHQTHIFDTNKSSLLKKIIEIQSSAHSFIKASDYLIITFGSAYVYEHIELKQVVANCHKFPPSVFAKKLLSIDEIIQSYHALFQKLISINPKITIILSVSPVKYLSYGTIDNNISKATLILTVHQLCRQFTNVYYFPAYELITDDLRDYRFFKADMAHPNELAIQYVMEKFSASAISHASTEVIKRLEKIMAAMSHKINYPDSLQAKSFAQSMLQYCTETEKKYPYLNLSDEKKYFENLLT
ncbi:MAG: GSCFA domain-containing protein [Bacteroidia bacterium]|nr:GSCFA domain-containing protein [Bacteroidia bacterium]